MHLVKGAINPHGGAQAAHSLVVPQLVKDGTQSGSHQVGRAEGDDCAHVVDGDAVFVGGLNPKTGKYLLGLLQTFLAPKNRNRKKVTIR